jgi:hypothetical protein
VLKTGTTRRELIAHWPRIRRSLAQFSGSDALCRMPWLAGCITNTSESKFSAHTPAAPSVLSLFSEHPKAVDAIPVSEGSVETDRVVGQDDGGPGVASASPSCDKGRRRASSIATQAPPETSKINAFNRSRAARSTHGDSACAKPQHPTRSNIHSGISRQRAAPSAVSAHRNVRVLPLVTTSWTNTRRPNQGCQG